MIGVARALFRIGSEKHPGDSSIGWRTTDYTLVVGLLSPDCTVARACPCFGVDIRHQPRYLLV